MNQKISINLMKNNNGYTGYLINFESSNICESNLNQFINLVINY